jgi:hypothetical protein
MPLVRIDHGKSHPAGFGKAVGEIVYRAMIEVINVPADDKFQIITTHDGSELNVAHSYLGIEYSPQHRLHPGHLECWQKHRIEEGVLPPHRRRCVQRTPDSPARCVHQPGGSGQRKLVLWQRRDAIRAHRLILRHSFSPANNTRLGHLCGPLDEHLRTIELALEVKIAHSHEKFKIDGHKAKAERALEMLQAMYERAAKPIPKEQVQLMLAGDEHMAAQGDGSLSLATRRNDVRPARLPKASTWTILRSTTSHLALARLAPAKPIWRSPVR